jgi:hypothetical protein
VSDCPSSPSPRLPSGLVAVAALPPNQCRSLLGHLARSPRKQYGRRHTLGVVLAVAVAAVLASARSLAAIGEWTADVTQSVLAALGSAAIR